MHIKYERHVCLIIHVIHDLWVARDLFTSQTIRSADDVEMRAALKLCAGL